MPTVPALIRRHAVLTYFALTFAISWGGVLFVLFKSAGMTGLKAQDNPLFPFALVAMVAGPSMTGLLLTGLVDGKRGLRELRNRLLAWRVGVRWYAVALLIAPLVALAIALTLSFVSDEFRPAIFVANDKVALVLLGLLVGCVAGFFEELGWTGFAIPRLRLRLGVLATGLTLGLLWSAWHILVVYWGIGNRAGAIPIPLFILVDGLAGLPAFRVLMVWVYDHTESLFVAMLMHVSITATTIVLTPLTTGWLLLAYGLAFAAAVWVVIATIAVAGGHRVSRATLRKRAA